MNALPPHPVKRRLLGLLVCLVSLPACKVVGGERTDQLPERFRGTGGIGQLKLDALTKKEYVTFIDDKGTVIASLAGLSLRNSSSSDYPGVERRVPKTIRAIWREGTGWDSVNKVWNEGTIVGDHTVPVADRIPDEVLDYIRTNGGALRLKIRLIDDGVLIGWDVEERVPLKTPGAGNYLRYAMPGGDFKEARPVEPFWDGHRFISLPSSMPLPLSAEHQAILEEHHLMLVGKEGGIKTIPPTPSNYRSVWEKGWYINRRTGQKIETDY